MSENRNAKDQSGVSIIEFVFCFPILLILMAFICDFGICASRYIVIQSQAVEAVRFIEIFTSPTYFETLSDLGIDIMKYDEDNNEDFSTRWFSSDADDQGRYILQPTDSASNGAESDSNDLYTLLYKHLITEFDSSGVCPVFPQYGEDGKNTRKWQMEVYCEPTTLYSSALKTENKEKFDYYVSTGAASSGRGYPTSSGYHSRESNFKTVNVEVNITYTDRYIFAMPYLVKILGHDVKSDTEATTAEYSLGAHKVGTFYIGGNNW